MKKLALITLRNDYITQRSESRDSIDTEIYNLLLEIDSIPFLIPNTPAYVDNFDLFFNPAEIKFVLLSGGNDLNSLKDKGATNIYLKRDKIEISLINFCIKNNIPIIGICRGFQLIANYLGGSIDKVEDHINRIHKVEFIQPNKIIDVNSFHSFGLKQYNLPKNIKPIAYHKQDNTVECFKTERPFKSLNFMWHPERKNGAKKESIRLIKNFLNK